MRKFMRIGALAALTFAGIVGFSGSASANGTATIELHFRECPADAVHVFEDCHHHPSTGYDAYLADIDDDPLSEMVPLDEDGNAVFDDVEPGEYTGSFDQTDEDSPVWPDDYITSYCSLEGGDGSDIEPKSGDDPELFDWLFTVEAGDHVVCDIYFAGGEAHGHDDDADGGAALPNTGAGAAAGETAGGIYLAGALALAGLAVASRKRALR